MYWFPWTWSSTSCIVYYFALHFIQFNQVKQNKCSCFVLQKIKLKVFICDFLRWIWHFPCHAELLHSRCDVHLLWYGCSRTRVSEVHLVEEISHQNADSKWNKLHFENNIYLFKWHPHPINWWCVHLTVVNFVEHLHQILPFGFHEFIIVVGTPLSLPPQTFLSKYQLIQACHSVP